MGLQRVGHDLATKQQQKNLKSWVSWYVYLIFFKVLPIHLFRIFTFLLKYSWFTMLCFRCTPKWFSYTYIYIHVSIFKILFHYRLLWDTECSSLCYTVGSCWYDTPFLVCWVLPKGLRRWWSLAYCSPWGGRVEHDWVTELKGLRLLLLKLWLM